jgi:signal transduction histidine kinase
MVAAVRELAGRVLGPLTGSDTSVLAKMLASFLAVLALASLSTLLLETRLTRQQLEAQARELFAESGDVLDQSIANDAVRTNQLMSTVAASQFRGNVPGASETGLDERARDTLSIVRTSDPSLELVGVVDATTGRIIEVGLPSRQIYADLDRVEAQLLLQRSGSTQRVVPLDGGGYAVAFVLPIGRLSAEPRLLVTGYPLDRTRARRYQEQTGVDQVEIVVDGVVIASTGAAGDGAPSGDVTRLRSTEVLPDGRLARYVAIGADQPWNIPTVIGLITDDPLAALDRDLARTRLLMVALLVVVGGALAFALAQVMTRPIVRLTNTATAIAAGELERPFDLERRDEIGRLGEALERMRRALRTQLLVIRHQASALQEAARRIVGVQDAERQRIAQDLHDGIQQQLVVLRMQVGVAQSQLERDPERLEEVTGALADAIDHLLDQLRTTGHDLFPSILRDRGLDAALFSLAARTPVPLELGFDPQPLPRSPAEVEINAYFLASEAITNALKHADAAVVRVTVQHEGQLLRIRVEDDGRGFDPMTTDRRGGLVHMRDRVNALGGSLQLVSRRGDGTAVTALFPLEPGSAGGSLQVEQDGGDAAVELDGLAEPQLAEDGVGVLLDRTVADRQLPGDGDVAHP